MVASTFGLSAAKLRTVAPVVGPRLVYWNKLSAAIDPFAKPPAVLGRLKAVERILE